MTTFRRILTAGALATLAVTLASADTINSIATFGTTSTDVTKLQTTGTLTNFQSTAGYVAGDVLQSVQLLMTITESVTGLTFSNLSNPQTSQTFNYLTTATFSLGGTAPTSDLNSLKSQITGTDNLYSIGDPFAVGGATTQTIKVGETLTYVPGPPSSSPTSGDINPSLIGAYSADSGNSLGTACGGSSNTDVNPCNLNLTTFASNIANYDTTGTFTLDYATATATTFFTGGGNVQQSQQTTTGATYEVIYNFTPAGLPSSTPEPATMALMGGALLGLGLIGKKRFKKS